MRVRRLVRVAGYVAGSRARGSAHMVRRRVAPQRWTRSDPNRILWVPPDAVVATTAERLGPTHRGRILDGDWDLDALPLRDLGVWRGLHQRVREGRDWEDTDLAPGRHVPEAPNVGRRSVDLSPEGLADRFASLDALTVSLREDGWLAHHDVGATFEREMAVVIGRDGRLIRDSGGLHRLVIAQLLGLERIPCRVLAEHARLHHHGDGRPDDDRTRRPFGR